MPDIEKVTAILQARTGSTRFPHKVFQQINGKSILDMVVDRVKAVNVLLGKEVIERIIIATTSLPEDYPIYERAGYLGVAGFCGDPTDVLDRYYKCSLQYKAKWILRVTCDCPFIDPILLSGLITKQPRKEYQALGINRGVVPDGLDAELFSFEELERTYKRATKPEDREHVTLKMRNAGSDLEDYGTDFDYKWLKLSIDTPENLKKAREYAKYL